MGSPLYNLYYEFREAVLCLPNFCWDLEWFPITAISTFHAIRVAMFLRYLFSPGKSTEPVRHVPVLQALVVNIILALGGGILSSIFFGRQIPWLTNNWVLPTYSFIHFAIMYSPNDLVFKFFNTLHFSFNPFLVISDGASRAFALMSVIDHLQDENSAFSHSYVAMILAGTVAACGGGIMLDLFKLSSLEWGLQTPSFLRKVPLGIKTPFILSCIYTIFTSSALHKAYWFLLSSANPVIHKYIDSILALFTGIAVDDVQFLVVFTFVLVLIYEEYFKGPMFVFFDKSQIEEIEPMVNGIYKEEDIIEKVTEEIEDFDDLASITSGSRIERSITKKSVKSFVKED